MARHAAVPSSISNGFDLGGMACCIQHSVFDVVCVCASMGLALRDGSGASGGDVSRSGVLHASEATMHS